MNRKHIACFALGIIVLLSSCSMPGQAVPTSTAMPSPTATAVPSPIFTPTPILPPMLLIGAETACRTGPGAPYDLVETLPPGTKVEIVGKAETFWIVKSSMGAECWVFNEQINIEGEVSALPVVIAPPTPTPSLPTAPDHFKLVSQKCSIDNSNKPVMYVSEFRFTWQDLSNNEDGFRLYRDNDLVAEITADTTEVTDVVIRRNKRTYFYYVAAYNEVGETKGPVKSFRCGK